MNLTKTEQEILTRLQNGENDKRIACDMCITQGTMRRHIHNITKKYNVHSRFDLPGFPRPLPPGRKQVFDLYMNGLPVTSIAEELNTDVSTINTYIWKMRSDEIDIPYRKEWRK